MKTVSSASTVNEQQESAGDCGDDEAASLGDSDVNETGKDGKFKLVKAELHQIRAERLALAQATKSYEQAQTAVSEEVKQLRKEVQELKDIVQQLLARNNGQ